MTTPDSALDVRCRARPDSDGHEALAAYYVEWDEVGPDGQTYGYAASCCIDCTARLRRGERFHEYMNRPKVVLVRDIEQQLRRAAAARTGEPA